MFNIGDKLYRIYEQVEWGRHKCEACDGEGSVILMDCKPHTCPLCNGTRGRKYIESSTWMVTEKKEDVMVIHRRIDSEGETIRYELSDEGAPKVALEENLFEGKSDAEAECEVRNNG